MCIISLKKPAINARFLKRNGGGFTWAGLVVVTGTVTFNVGGSGVNITGAVMSGDAVTLSGALEIYYNSCAVGESLSSLGYRMINWRQL